MHPWIGTRELVGPAGWSVGMSLYSAAGWLGRIYCYGRQRHASGGGSGGNNGRGGTREEEKSRFVVVYGLATGARSRAQ